MRMGPSLQRKGPGRVLLPIQAPNHKPSLLSKLTLAPAIRSYPTTASFTACISSRRDTKTVMSSANAETLAVSPLIPKPAQEGLQREDIDEKRQRAALPDRTFDRKRLRKPSVHLHHCLIHLRNSGLNPAVSKTVAENRWSTLLKALDWSKLISAASVSSFIPSRTSRIKCRLSWIDLPFTAKVCSGPIRSLMTSCKRFAKTCAKIFNPPQRACHLSSAMWSRP